MTDRWCFNRQPLTQPLAGPLRLTSARVDRAHARAVGRAGEHLFCMHRLLVPLARDLSLCWRELTWPEVGEDDDARDEE